MVWRVGSGPSLFAPGTVRGRSWITSEFADRLWVVDTESGMPAGSHPTGDRPYPAAVMWDGSHAFVPNLDAGTVSVIDLLNRETDATVEVCPGPPGGALEPIRSPTSWRAADRTSWCSSIRRRSRSPAGCRRGSVRDPSRWSCPVMAATRGEQRGRQHGVGGGPGVPGGGADDRGGGAAHRAATAPGRRAGVRGQRGRGHAGGADSVEDGGDPATAGGGGDIPSEVRGPGDDPRLATRPASCSAWTSSAIWCARSIPTTG